MRLARAGSFSQEKYKIYESTLFHTTVTDSAWDETHRRWIVKTDRGDEMKAKFVVMANGILTISLKGGGA